MSCCVSGVDGGRDLKGATAKKKRIKEKREEERNNRWCLVQPTIRSNHEPQKEMRGNSVSPVTRHWTDIIQSFLALSSFALCVRCSELQCALVCSLEEEEEVVIWFRAKFLFRENQPKKLPKKRRRRRVKEDAAADFGRFAPCRIPPSCRPRSCGSFRSFILPVPSLDLVRTSSQVTSKSKKKKKKKSRVSHY